MSEVVTLTSSGWDVPFSAAEQELAVRALEGGSVLEFPRLGFPLLDGEDRLLSPSIAGNGKNVSLGPAGEGPRGSTADDEQLSLLRSMMVRFALSTRTLLQNLAPHYTAGLERARTSFRPVEIAGRSNSWRKDDTRLHVDSFPSSPTRGRRILRVFTNLNPHGQSRTWRLGEPFERVASRFLDSIPGPAWGASALLKVLGVTKGRRSAYDHFMLQLHDRMKADSAYQTEAAQCIHQFHAGSTWIVYTDQVSHAAMSGQYALEQTFYLPVDCMLTPASAPLRVLEHLLRRALT